jgi:hypothetical protein
MSMVQSQTTAKHAPWVLDRQQDKLEPPYQQSMYKTFKDYHCYVSLSWLSLGPWSQHTMPSSTAT